MGAIVWLASYPKSGNTWVRMLLNNYFLGDVKRQNLNSLDLTTFGGSSMSSYRAITKKDVEALSDDEVMQLTPAAHRYIASLRPEVTFVKTHNLLSTNFGIPLITADVTKAGLYVVRNPLDTVISVADHFGLDIDRAIKFMNNRSGSTAPNETMVRQIFSSWSMNVASWTTQPPFPVWTIRYEDLHSSPERTMRNALQFLGAEIDRKKLVQAIKQSSFKSLKSMEKKDGFVERSRHSKAFFRSGKTDQWKSKLTAAQIRQIVDANRQQMQRFNYIPDGY
ncbi:sulfotransferase domain-containing protein [Sneathiella glossodoripedis]|uniref:sulfotransferase domain-containing protein n=1 Tax=Sneathiella glossodoripedis TaxID=418853 RepID=UPI000471EB2F|nr:sulfotransferase domain-containing protein [Sneathiella glossodoripedis]